MTNQKSVPHTDNDEKPVTEPGHMPTQPVTKREDEPKEAPREEAALDVPSKPQAFDGQFLLVSLLSA